MRLGAIGKSLAVAATASLFLAGCSSSTDTSATPTGTTGAMSGGGIILANGTEPENPLIPTNTNEVGGGRVVDSIFAGLVYYDASGAVHNEVAKSITAIDPMNYEVKLNDGWTFTNGEPVTAKSFVDAWQYGALASNAQLNSYFFEDIEGFSYDGRLAFDGPQRRG